MQGWRTPKQGEPPAPGRGVNLALRYLGIILPVVVTYWLGLWLGLGWGNVTAMRLLLAFGAASPPSWS